MGFTVARPGTATLCSTTDDSEAFLEPGGEIG